MLIFLEIEVVSVVTWIVCTFVQLGKLVVGLSGEDTI